MKKSSSSSSMLSNDTVTTEKYVYQDRSRVPDDGSYKVSAFSRLSLAAMRVQKLPPKLYAILSVPEFSHIITWMPHGRSWKVLDTKGFQEEVMPHFFEYTNYESFIRLVNAWGFNRVPSGPDRNSYFHEVFLKGVPHLLGKMRRMTDKDKRLKVGRENQPDFYNISERYPLPSVSNTTVCSGSSTDSEVQRSIVDTSGLRLLSSVSDGVSVSSDLSQVSSLSKTSSPVPRENSKLPTVSLLQLPRPAVEAPNQNIMQKCLIKFMSIKLSQHGLQNMSQLQGALCTP